MLFNAHGMISSDLPKLQEMIRNLNEEQVFAIVCWITRKTFVKALNPVYFPGFYLLAYGVDTRYLGFVHAATMAILTLLQILAGFILRTEAVDRLHRAELYIYSCIALIIL
jgi:hypothetical protein